jgi:hypothetical protein
LSAENLFGVAQRETSAERDVTLWLRAERLSVPGFPVAPPDFPIVICVGSQSVQGIQGVTGTARAYGFVAVDGTLTRSKNVTGVTNPSAGHFCIALAAGIDASQTALVATPDFTNDSTTMGIGNAKQAIVEWDRIGSNCPAGQLQVETGFRTESLVGSADGDVRQVTNTENDELFFFVVP